MAREQADLTHDLCYVTKTEDWGLCNLVYVKVFSLSLGIGVVGLRHGLYNATVVRVTYVLRSSREASVFPHCLQTSPFRA